jgi:hypothetical protein
VRQSEDQKSLFGIQLVGCNECIVQTDCSWRKIKVKELNLWQKKTTSIDKLGLADLDRRAGILPKLVKVIDHQSGFDQSGAFKSSVPNQ